MRKLITKLAHELTMVGFNSELNAVTKSQWLGAEDLRQAQERELRHAMRFAFDHVPYYHKMFRKLALHPMDITHISDLQRLPVLTKSAISESWLEFTPVGVREARQYSRATGGTTGTPFQYRICQHDRAVSTALLYRGWGYADFKIGNPMVFFGGASIGVSSNLGTMNRLESITRNIRKLSSFDMSDADLRGYARTINTFKPMYIRGYPSSIYFFAKWSRENDIRIATRLRAVFTTAEKLYPEMRKTIEGYFDCEVFDTYGLNDGGVTAYECGHHCGLHVDTERSILEVVDEDRNQISDGRGTVLATSLRNHSMPFIRYDTGDEVRVSSEDCPCGRRHRLLKEVEGRSVDILMTPEGKRVHGWFFLYIFWRYPEEFTEYQVVQENVNEITINYIPTEKLKDETLIEIREIVAQKSNLWRLTFRRVDRIERTASGKYKFIINKTAV